jgi:Protein of unknown function (DUF2934)
MKPKAKPKTRDIRPAESHNGHNGRNTDNSPSDDWRARVAVLAYSFYQRRGHEDGHDVEDWIQAEKTIRDEIASQQDRI